MSAPISFFRRTIAAEDVHRVRLTWDEPELEAHLRRLWTVRDRRRVVLDYSVRTRRMLGAMGRRLDRKGWRLDVIGMPDTNQVAVGLVLKYRGARALYAKQA